MGGQHVYHSSHVQVRRQFEALVLLSHSYVASGTERGLPGCHGEHLQMLSHLSPGSFCWPWVQSPGPYPTANKWKDLSLQCPGLVSLSSCYKKLGWSRPCLNLRPALLRSGGVCVLLLWSLDPSIPHTCGNGHNLVSVWPHPHH